MNTTLCFPLVALGLMLGGMSRLSAQWVTEEIALHPGWNAVFLEVQPEPAACDAVFGSLPGLERVVTWNRRFTPVQFVQDPGAIGLKDPDWLTYLPAGHAMAAESNLHGVEGGRCYLIRIADSVAPFVWRVRGTPVLPRHDWLTDSLSLVGFGVPTASPPTFASFFAASTAHAGQPIYRLSAAGQWQAVSDPAVARLQGGEAFWVHTRGISDFEGPLRVSTEQQRRLDFGRSLAEQTLRLENVTAAARAVVIRPAGSEPPPVGVEPALAGPVPLSYWQPGDGGWADLTGGLQVTIPAQAEWTIRLAVRRKDFSAYALPLGVTSALYQSILEVQEVAGASRYRIPVTAQGAGVPGSPFPKGPVRPTQTKNGEVSPQAGLWVGSVVLSEVSQAAATDPDTLLPAASTFQFRVLVHVDEAGQARLLRKVLQLWKEGSYQPDPTDPTRRIVDVPGRFVLVTDDRLIPGYSGAALRDGQAVGRRFSTTAFGFNEPVPMTGQFGSALAATVTLDYDDPVNPFKHRYHPDHDNLPPDFGGKLAEGVESYTVQRNIQLQFGGADPDGFELAGWGDTQTGGVYQEDITGLHHATIHLRGTFRLHRASRVGVLNH
jgi:hypothetical protein